MDELKKDYNLHGKIAIVTGGARGIGEGIARKLGRYGATLVISDILDELGEKTAAEIGSDSIFIRCDISNNDQVSKMIDQTVKKYGKLDIMVNNAGINTLKKEERVNIDEYPIELWHKIMNINLHGTFYGCRASSRQMVKQKSGVIINTASITGVVPLRLQIGYCVSKSGIIALTKAMAIELAKSGVRVNSISPGSILSEGTKKLFYGEDGSFSDMAKNLLASIPQGRPGSTDEMGDAVAFLTSDAAKYITGHNLVVDGGWLAGYHRDF